MGKDKVVDYLDSSEVLAQLAEECSEAAQAALKMRRALDGVNPTPVTPEEAMSNLIEELADVAHCALVLFGQERDGDDEENIANEVCDTITKIVEQKHERWLKRLAENEEKILDESDEVLIEQDCPHCHNDVVIKYIRSYMERKRERKFRRTLLISGMKFHLRAAWSCMKSLLMRG